MSNTEALGAADAPVATFGESVGGAFTAPEAGRTPFQARVYSHLVAVTDGDPTDLAERIARFFEEGAELVQSLGLSYGDAQAVVDYVYSRPAGEPHQELGGTMTTLAGLATLAGHDMMACGEEELARTWSPEVFAKIRRKRAGRHGRGPLPGVDGDLVTTVVVSGGRHPAEPSDPNEPIFRRQVFISRPEVAAPKDIVGQNEAPDDITPEAVATLQAKADAEGKGETWETIDSPEMHALRDLAHVLDAQIEEGVILPDGMGLVIAALGRVHPDRVHPGARCQVPECLVHGPCSECPSEAQWQALDGLLTIWLAAHPRMVTIHKTQNVGKTEALLKPFAQALDSTYAAACIKRAAAQVVAPVATRATEQDWNPAGAYPIDGTIIEVEGRGRMRYCLDKTSAYCANHQLGGWLIDMAAPDGHWVTTERPTGRWRKAPPVRV